MANTLYDIGRRVAASTGLDWENTAYSCILVDTGQYTPNFSSHQYLDDISASAYAASGTQALSAKAIDTNGALDANDVTFPNVSGGDNLEAVIIYQNTGNAATSTLIAYLDTATGLPITPNGGDIIVTWDNGVNKILRL